MYLSIFYISIYEEILWILFQFWCLLFLCLCYMVRQMFQEVVIYFELNGLNKWMQSGRIFVIIIWLCVNFLIIFMILLLVLFGCLLVLEGLVIYELMGLYLFKFMLYGLSLRMDCIDGFYNLCGKVLIRYLVFQKGSFRVVLFMIC